jgi:DNA-binding transcriptional regulator YiaG
MHICQTLSAATSGGRLRIETENLLHAQFLHAYAALPGMQVKQTTPWQMPAPDEIKAARLAVGLSQAQAAELVGLGSAHRWSEYERGAKNISPQTWRLFLLLTRQEKLPVMRGKGKA